MTLACCGQAQLPAVVVALVVVALWAPATASFAPGSLPDFKASFLDEAWGGNLPGLHGPTPHCCRAPHGLEPVDDSLDGVCVPGRDCYFCPNGGGMDVGGERFACLCGFRQTCGVSACEGVMYVPCPDCRH